MKFLFVGLVIVLVILLIAVIAYVTAWDEKEAEELIMDLKIWKYAKEELPKQQTPLLVYTVTGEIYEGHWLKDANYREQNVRRWRIYSPRIKKTISEDQVVFWCYKEDMIKYFELDERQDKINEIENN